MSSTIKIKDEPVDSEYENMCIQQPTVKDEPSSRTEATAQDSEDEFAWVNDELDFLNEIDDLIDESTPAVNSTVESDKTEAHKLNVGNSSPTNQLNVTIKTEKENNTVAETPKELFDAELNANNNAVESAQQVYSEKSTSEQDPLADAHLPTKELTQTAGSKENENISERIEKHLNGFISTSVPPEKSSPNTAQNFLPVRVKQEKISPPREIFPSSSQRAVSQLSLSPLLSNEKSIQSPLPTQPLNSTVQPQPPLPAQPPLPPDTPGPPPPPPQRNMPAPVVIKQERVSPPLPLASTHVEPSISRKRQPESPPRSKETSHKRQRSRVDSPESKESPKKSLDDLDSDAAFLEMQRQKLVKKLEKLPKKTYNNAELTKRASTSSQIPVPIKIKVEPLDYDSRPVDMEIENDGPEPPNLVANPMSLKLMPQPLKIKQEPVDSYEMKNRKNVPLRPIKVELNDDRPLSHRERVIKFAKDTIKNFELFKSVPKLQRRFLYTPVILIRENAEKIVENRSPLNSSVGIQYEFSSVKLPINTERFGVFKLSEHTAKIVRLLGFNAYEFTRKLKCSKLEKLEDDELTKETIDRAAFYVNNSSQTDELKCNRCIVRKLKKYVDRSAQVSMGPINESGRSSAPSYDNVSQEMIQTLSQLAPAQQTALMEFTELILGPAPTSTNDVVRMREKLMDIFTLAQSRSHNSKSNSSITSNITPTSVLFNQPAPHPTTNHRMNFPSMSSPQDRDSLPHVYQQNHANYNSMSNAFHHTQQMPSMRYQAPLPVPPPFAQPSQTYRPSVPSVPMPPQGQYDFDPNYPTHNVNYTHRPDDPRSSLQRTMPRTFGNRHYLPAPVRQQQERDPRERCNNIEVQRH